MKKQWQWLGRSLVQDSGHVLDKCKPIHGCTIYITRQRLRVRDCDPFVVELYYGEIATNIVLPNTVTTLEEAKVSAPCAIRKKLLEVFSKKRELYMRALSV